ncbi:hypothetical protein TBLA_0A01040 [Henningerozyma blattae CBS 6284]|uniref:RRM domain-containing protein n=1 Tax=Henningerozyma blattae (strain ATCC 34711 / CBS 6284 / DSM 70876 / NBRC 10599 / NRRL Y-10934 / UCD 77-7) TaxID=1071380 RepID=I2GUV2_HENB6|nr:hypothetical protein TBLA_0A01040 [Tetrapisispora blattae CBS 6284]CCH57904.1 hypothetical protein TBLA_0A01040 [Tetrapisispora blattae CBS 6284]
MEKRTPVNDSNLTRTKNSLISLNKISNFETQAEADKCSIFIGNIDPSVTPDVIEEHFKVSGQIKRITLFGDGHASHSKGYAYVEFISPSGQENALKLNGSVLNNKRIIVQKKRTNLPRYKRNNQDSKGVYFHAKWNSSKTSDSKR